MTRPSDQDGARAHPRGERAATAAETVNEASQEGLLTREGVNDDAVKGDPEEAR